MIEKPLLCPRLALVALALLLAVPAQADPPPTVQERTAAQHDRQRAQRAREREQREERAQVRDAKRSANDLGLTGHARRRYVDLHRGAK
jgi:hypothetical protein